MCAVHLQPPPPPQPPVAATDRIDGGPSNRTILRIVLIVLAVAVGVLTLRLIWQPLTWIIIASFLAIALSGPVNLLERRMRRGSAITIVYLSLLLVPAGIAALIVPPLVTQGVDFVNNLPKYSKDFQRQVQKNPKLRKLNKDFGFTDRLDTLANDAPSKIGQAATVVRDVGTTLLSSIFAGFTIFVLSIFMVARGKGWVEAGIRLRGGRQAEALTVAVERIGAAVGNYIAGAVVQATIAAISAFLVLTILGVPFAGALAVFIGVMDLLPLIGATIGAVLVGVVTLFNDFPTATIIWVIFAIAYQQFENYVIQPQIQRRAVELEPFIVLVSVLLGGTLFGVIGALLAIPIAASIQIAVQEWWRFRGAEQLMVIESDPPHPPGPIGPAGGSGPGPAPVVA